MRLGVWLDGASAMINIPAKPGRERLSGPDLFLWGTLHAGYEVSASGMPQERSLQGSIMDVRARLAWSLAGDLTRCWRSGLSDPDARVLRVSFPHAVEVSTDDRLFQRLTKRARHCAG